MFLARSSMSPVDFNGLRIFDCTAGQSLGSSVAMIEVGPGVEHKEAWSLRSDKYYLVVAGELRFVLDGNEQLMTAGNFCFIKQGGRFSYSNLALRSPSWFSSTLQVLFWTQRCALSNCLRVRPTCSRNRAGLES